MFVLNSPSLLKESLNRKKKGKKLVWKQIKLKTKTERKLIK